MRIVLLAVALLLILLLALASSRTRPPSPRSADTDPLAAQLQRWTTDARCSPRTRPPPSLPPNVPGFQDRRCRHARRGPCRLWSSYSATWAAPWPSSALGCWPPGSGRTWPAGPDCRWSGWSR